MATILLVDDERLLCDLLQDFFTEAGHQVWTAYTGEDALQLFRQQRPQVTILDLILPDLDGVTVLRELRTMDATAPVIAVTAFTGLYPDLEQAVLTLGVSALLPKDIDLETLLQAVTQARPLPARTVTTPPSAAPEAPARILVVDDEPAFRTLLDEFLTQEGYRVWTAADGEEALQLVSETQPHLVLLDLKLPKLNGLTVLRRLAKECRELGVIVITGHPSDASVQEAMTFGSFDYFTKPVDLEPLGVSIRAKLALLEAKRHPWWRRWLARGTPN
ncbi:MAG: response regulator [Nitrospinae bacterium]|nr:response regulator [Nitrospinota bacterium]